MRARLLATALSFIIILAAAYWPVLSQVINGVYNYLSSNQQRIPKVALVIPEIKRFGEAYLQYLLRNDTPYEWTIYYNRTQYYEEIRRAPDFKFGALMRIGERSVSNEIIRQKLTYDDKCNMKLLFESFDKISNYSLKSSQFHPQSYCIRKILPADGELNSEEKAFLNESSIPSQSEQLWIEKQPMGVNGYGLRLLSNISAYRESYLQHRRIVDVNESRSQVMLVQKYLPNPMLLEGRKFDLRVYVMLLCTGTSHIILYHYGYVRRTAYPFSREDVDLVRHVPHPNRLDNLTTHVAHEDLWNLKSETHITLEHFAQLMVAEYGTTPAQLDQFYHEMKQALTYGILAGLPNLGGNQRGSFHVFGCDVVMDDNRHPWFIEINVYPNTRLDTKVKIDLLPKLAESTIELLMHLQSHWEQFEVLAAKLNKENLGSYEILYNGLSGYNILNDQTVKSEENISSNNNNKDHARNQNVDEL